MRIFTKIIGLLLVVFLTACGGGGGSAGTVVGGTSGSGTTVATGTTSTATTATTTAVVAVPTLALGIFNGSNVSVVSISLGGGFVARATVKDAAGLPVASRLVTFSIGGAAIATLAPLTALTNASGVAEVSIAPASVSSIGAATVSASANISGTAVTSQADFSVQASSLVLSNLMAGSTSIASGANTSVQVTALVGGVAISGVPVNVSFTTSCGRINSQDTSLGGVSITSNGAGVAAAVYDAISADGSLCTGLVSITTSSAGATQRSININVAAPTANAVVFVSALPAQIFVAGSGAIDQAIVKFKVLSSSNTGLASVPVRFSIVTNPGGVGLGAAGSTSPVTANTNSNGDISIAVFSGTIPGAVKVRAELVSNALVFSESQNLTVASGPPSQERMDLSVETYNIEGWAVSGVSTQLTVRIADRQGNAVDDGTVINFTAEGGQVARSCATARVNGVSLCSVSFISQNPRPAGGRASVLAYTNGTKTYIDTNGNNTYDPGIDTLVNIGDAFRDDNENGTYDTGGVGEFLIPRGGSLACPGAGALFPSRANTCDVSLQTTVRQQAVILFSSTTPSLDVVSAGTGGVSFKLRSFDNLLLPLPLGSTFSAQANDIDTNDGFACAVDKVFGSPVPNVSPTTNPLSDLATTGVVTLKNCRAGDSVVITVKVPSGLETSFFIPL